LADEAHRTKDAEVLTEAVRKALNRSITRKYMNEVGEVQVLTLEPRIEELLAGSLLQTEAGVQLVMDPKQAQGLLTQISRGIEQHPEIAAQPILLTSATARRHLYKLTSRFIPQLIVLSHNEISPDAQIQSVGLVEMSHAG
jgi:flagellar biosynthesis protein FlhA